MQAKRLLLVVAILVFLVSVVACVVYFVILPSRRQVLPLSIWNGNPYFTVRLNSTAKLNAISAYYAAQLTAKQTPSLELNLVDKSLGGGLVSAWGVGDSRIVYASTSTEMKSGKPLYIYLYLNGVLNSQYHWTTQQTAQLVEDEFERALVVKIENPPTAEAQDAPLQQLKKALASYPEPLFTVSYVSPK